jgi:heme oxygenase (biliverdin-IX-beta and delta-forming)
LSLLDQLRAATAALHAAVERETRMADLTSPGLSRAAYADTLVRLEGYYRPLEAGLRPHAGRLPLPLVDRTARLHRDLDALGVAPRPEAAPVPDLSAPEAALGALYVVEGAALGGRVITRAVGAALGLTAETGLAFFSGEGAGPGPRWRRLRDVLTASPGSEAAVEAAVGTFASLYRWMAPPL